MNAKIILRNTFSLTKGVDELLDKICDIWHETKEKKCNVMIYIWQYKCHRMKIFKKILYEIAFIYSDNKQVILRIKIRLTCIGFPD